MVTTTFDDVDEHGRRRRWSYPDRCDVAGCPERVTWVDDDLADLETGTELPGVFCFEHTIAYLHRQR